MRPTMAAAWAKQAGAALGQPLLKIWAVSVWRGVHNAIRCGLGASRSVWHVAGFPGYVQLLVLCILLIAHRHSLRTQMGLTTMARCFLGCPWRHLHV